MQRKGMYYLLVQRHRALELTIDLWLERKDLQAMVIEEYLDLLDSVIRQAREVGLR